MSLRYPTVNVHRLRTKNIGDLSSAVFGLIGQAGRTIDVADNPWQMTGRHVVVGGGGLFYGKLPEFIDRIADHAPRSLVGWGIGFNVHGAAGVTEYPACARRFDLLGVRDDGQEFRWVPCPTCLSPLFDNPAKPTRRLVVYAHYQRSDLPIPGLDAPLLRNNAPTFREVIDFLASAEFVLTDTYHGAYWATLLGRRVILYKPWSSKFYAMRHPPTFCQSGQLDDAMERARQYADALSECREANRNFEKDVRALWASRDSAS